ncbi:MAG TPA: cytochrome P450 [Saprospiraceae bacterium]|nr:cytochrome P450 [Saprospiraceae bacterium]
MAVREAQIWNPFTEGYINDPYHYLSGLREDGELCRTINGHVLTLSYRLAKEVLQNNEFRTLEIAENLRILEENHFAQSNDTLITLRSIVSKWLLFLNPPLHTVLRKLMADIFNRYRLTDIIQEVVDDVLSKAIQAKNIDTIQAIATPIPMKVIGRLMGLDDHAVLSLRSGLYSVGRIIEPFVSRYQLQEHDKSATAMLEYFQGVFEHKKKHPEDDFISDLIREGGKELPMSQLVSLALQLFWAGVETTIFSIGQTIYYLAQYPDEWQMIKKNPDVIKSATEEFLRLASPVQYTVRIPPSDTRLDGIPVKARQIVYVSLAAANRDPDKFDNPHTCNAKRSPNPHVAFGQGIHTCLGARLGRDEIVRMLQWMADRDVQMSRSNEPEWYPIIMMRGIKSLQASIVARA